MQGKHAKREKSLAPGRAECTDLQYFIGKEEYRDEPPFEASMLVHFRKRITAEMLKAINERIHERIVKKNEQAR